MSFTPVRRVRSFLRWLLMERTAEQILVLGYVAACLVGFGLLLLPWSRSGSVSWIDILFTSVSAVSTTGLVTVPTGESYSAFGEVVTLLLFQVGGLGYMSIGSFILLERHPRSAPEQEEMVEADYSLPEDFELRSFARAVLGFTAFAEIAGAAALYPAFRAAGVDSPLWMAVYHSVSAFCTAGFSLFPHSLQGFPTNPWISLVILLLAFTGALGFVVVVDLVRRARGREDELSYTTRLILRSLLILGPASVALVYFTGSAFDGFPWPEKLLLTLFQTGSAATTVGFSTFPTETLSPAVLTFFMLVMVVGIAPGGTGGGVKLTTLVTLLAVMRARLGGRIRIDLMGRRVSSERVTLAATILFSHLLFIGAVIFLLALLEDQRFLPVAFETASAMGTVGLSMGITSELSAAGRLIIMVTMLVGRLRMLTFGLALLENTAGADRERRKEQEEERAREDEEEAKEEAKEGQGEGEAKETPGESGDGADDGEGAGGDDEEEAGEEELAM